MKLIVNHLTRMQRGYICVAGVDIENQQHVRPVLAGRLGVNLLAKYGGPFDIGNLVDLGSMVSVGTPPEVEDYSFNPVNTSMMRVVPPNTFWRMLQSMAGIRLTEIFGAQLRKIGSQSCGVAVGQGQASLGCVIPTNPISLYIKSQPDRRDQIRIRMRDNELGDLDLGVTDIRLYARNDHVTPNRSVISQIARQLARGVDIVLSIGLTRAFSPSTGLPSVHWLQVNNIHLRDNPIWQLQ